MEHKTERIHFLYLVRHSAVNPASARNELSEEGAALAVRFGTWLRSSGYPAPTALYASDRPRATQTIGHAALGMGSTISSVADTRADTAHGILLPEGCTGKNGLPLTITTDIQENNPPEHIVATEEYARLTAENRRAGILMDWSGKQDRVRLFTEAITRILDTEPCALVASHGNIIQQGLQALFPAELDLAAFNSVTPHIGLTVLAKDGGRIKLNRLFSTEWRYE